MAYVLLEFLYFCVGLKMIYVEPLKVIYCLIDVVLEHCQVLLFQDVSNISLI
jgi:hypothetical protein